MGCALAAAESVCCRCRGDRAACGAAFESTAAGDGHRRISVQERGRALPPRCIATRGGRAGGARCAALHCAVGQIIAADARAA